MPGTPQRCLVAVEPKFGTARRLISLPPPLAWALLAQRRTQDAERKLAADLWQDDGWVFAQANGRPIDPRADYDEWKTLLEAAGCGKHGYTTHGTPRRPCCSCSTSRHGWSWI
jgi:hypothetical protein